MADLDGVVLLAAVLGAKDMEPSRLGRRHRHAGGNDGMKRRGFGQDRRGAVPVHQGERLGARQRRDIGDRHQKCRRQEPGGFRQPDRRAGEGCVALAAALQRALHGRCEVARGIGHGGDPGRRRVAGHDEARDIAVIGTGLQRGGPLVGDGECQGAEGGECGETHGIECLGRKREHARAPGDERYRHAHAQVGAGAVQAFDDVGAEGHVTIHPGYCPQDSALRHELK